MLFPSTHRGRLNLASAQVNTSERGLYQKDYQMGHNSRSLGYQVYASYFCEGLGLHRLSGRIC